MTHEVHIGDGVEWAWGEHTAKGTVIGRFPSKATRTIKVTEVARLASDDEPAYLIEQDEGDEALEPAGELNRERNA